MRYAPYKTLEVEGPNWDQYGSFSDGHTDKTFLGVEVQTWKLSVYEPW